ncbi:MAG TPA: DNA mismatch repair protein MutS [Dehalococcoidia bacterium]|nr:DNA mismatch repair protein MutS [Dehalococcoidia bacterium]
MTTPIWRQYLGVKRRYPHAIVFFRLGDFYETFEDDARLCARELEITLTSKVLGRDLRVPLAGIPYHAVDAYLAKLIARGYKVAVCEQMADPATTKGLVPREVTRVVTPGTVLDEQLLDLRANNYLAAAVSDGERAGLASIDVSTGQFITAQLDAAELGAELLRLDPRELLTCGALPELPAGLPTSTALSGAALDDERAQDELLRHFGVLTLEGFGCAGKPLAICAAAAILRYLAENQPAVLSQVMQLATSSSQGWMPLDPQTARNLDLFEAGRSGGKAGSLLAAIDGTKTPMGARLLRRRLGRPLTDVGAINQRLDAVQWAFARGAARASLLGALARVGDIERPTVRIGAGSGSPRDLATLRRGLEQVEAIRARLAAEPPPALPKLPDLTEALDIIGAGLADEPGTLGQGEVIRAGFSQELDTLLAVSRDARGVLAELEQRERERSGIRSLKVGYNRVFGYYIEVSNAYKHAAPADYQRRQTLTGAERYVTPELKELEGRVLGAQERLETVETELFRGLCAAVAAHAGRIRAAAEAIAELDVAAGLAEIAALHDYCRPLVDDGDAIEIRAGRHPVVERVLPGAFVPNDAQLSAGGEQIIVLTGPNMAGKSTYLRQVALIVLLAQIGSFVPASSARIGVADRIFTRVGAQDDLAAGSSTFMVEMVETAQILNHCTPRSLIVFDEVGRGTSTYDGLAIARAVVEYLHNRERSAARTLFATHYHELTRLAATLPRVRNCSVAVGEEDGEVVFLHTIVPGGADRSYRVHVAQLAGLPRAVVQRAEAILAELEAPRAAAGRNGRAAQRAPTGVQLSLLAQPSPLVEELRALDIDALTPLDAIRRLYELREAARRE